MKKLPIGAGSAELVSVKYPAEAGGYTPGDTWDLYVSKEKRVQQFIYHRGGPKKPSLVTATWAGYKRQAHCCSQRSTAAPPMASPCTSLFLTSRLS